MTKVDPFSKVMARKLTSGGRKVFVTAELETFRKGVDEHKPDVVVLDGAAEFAPELCEWLKGRQQKQLTSLVTFYPEDEGPETRAGFRVLEDEFLVEPFELETLCTTIDAEVSRLHAERKYFTHTVRFISPSSPAYVQQSGTFLEQLIKHSGLAEEECLALVNASREALDNGARHGNKSDQDKVVKAEYVLSPKQVTITVEDEGPGFDTKAQLGDGIDTDAVGMARKRKLQGKVGGLGLMLMLRCVDKLEFNPKGNLIKLTKRLGAEDESDE
ncbi:MAG: ATP-binding protein [Planctomycetota bacterium]